jgi:uncharacterized membrane protein
MTTLHREYVAWGWAINGFASITGAVLTTVLAMIFGFGVVMLAALALYIIALLALRVLMGSSSGAVPAA